MSSPDKGERNRSFKIDVSDLESNQTSQIVEHIKRAQDVPLVREVGTERKNRGGLIALLWLGLAGIGGGFLTWVIWQVVTFPEDSFTSNLLTALSIAVVIGIVLIVVDSAQSRTIAKVGKALLIGAPSAIVISLLLGLVANALYKSLVEALSSRLQADGFDSSTQAFWDEFAAQNHLNRGLAWMFLGLAAGLAVGVSSLAWKRILVAGAGGLVGGFIGGFVFDFFQGQGEAQFVGLAITGLAVGLGIGLMEQATKTSWLEIVQGGMAGKQFILFKADITLGSSPSADVTLIKDPAIAGVAARIIRRGALVTIESLVPGQPIEINGQAVERAKLSEGGIISLGATKVRFRERAKNQVNAGVRR
jgi:hypothetical protein